MTKTDSRSRLTHTLLADFLQGAKVIRGGRTAFGTRCWGDWAPTWKTMVLHHEKSRQTGLRPIESTCCRRRWWKLRGRHRRLSTARTPARIHEALLRVGKANKPFFKGGRSEHTLHKDTQMAMKSHSTSESDKAQVHTQIRGPECSERLSLFTMVPTGES